MNDKERVARKARADALKKEASEKLGCSIHSLPIQINRTIQMQSALGEDFDPQKIEKVLEAFEQWESANHAIFEKAGTDFHSFPPSTKDEWKMNARRCWITIGAILGTEDFVKVFDEIPEDAALMMESL